MATDLDRHYSFLDELDARQDCLLGQLDQLNQRIELLLSQFGAPAQGAPPSLEESDQTTEIDPAYP